MECEMHRFRRRLRSLESKGYSSGRLRRAKPVGTLVARSKCCSPVKNTFICTFGGYTQLPSQTGVYPEYTRLWTLGTILNGGSSTLQGQTHFTGLWSGAVVHCQGVAGW